MNSIADEIKDFLLNKHSRVYRNRSPQNPKSPYVIYRIESTINSYPSQDLYVNIDVYDKANAGVRAIEEIADQIDNSLNNKVINTEELNLHFVNEQRQYVPPEELVSVHLINIRYVVRAYFK